MKAYVLNLEHRTDRKHSMESELSRMGIEPVFVPAPRVVQNGHAGCSIGHFLVMQQLLADDYNPQDTLVLEDDSIFLTDREGFDMWIDGFVAGKGDDWDAVFMGGFFQAMPWGDAKYVRPLGMIQTTAYMINRRFVPIWMEFILDRLVNRLRHDDHAYNLDMAWGPLIEKYGIYTFVERLITQADNFSDITGMNMNGGSYKELSTGRLSNHNMRIHAFVSDTHHPVP
jgi:hypothetical protein